MMNNERIYVRLETNRSMHLRVIDIYVIRAYNLV